MKQKRPIKIFLIDDDAVFLKLLEIEFLENGDFDIETYESGEQCIEMLKNKPDIIILDYLLDGMNKSAMNGLATLDKIKEFDPEIPVIILSAQDKIEVAVNCMHHKATDYVVKSETSFLRLKKIITNALKYNIMEKQLNWYMERM
ncbi:MAG: response regulator [Bacteroidetes bacterium HGW-Bacteroidetes-1]|jgi:DNA-binding NtrC family response regulator|nr:MAG: response regulator [Bacteroidetes bacterium HGW-Bacteroidetes-1]